MMVLRWINKDKGEIMELNILNKENEIKKGINWQVS